MEAIVPILVPILIEIAVVLAIALTIKAVNWASNKYDLGFALEMA